MKLRLTHNSIRIRIQRTELARLQETGKISEIVTFPVSRSFQFEVRIIEGAQVEAAFEADKLYLSLPRTIANSWIETSQVGIETQLPLQGSDHLHVLIEKDFPCLDRPNEDKSETFWELVDQPNKHC